MVYGYNECMVCDRLGDHVPGNSAFWQDVQRRGDGPVLALLKHKPSGKVILAGSTNRTENDPTACACFSSSSDVHLSAQTMDISFIQKSHQQPLSSVCGEC